MRFFQGILPTPELARFIGDLLEFTPQVSTYSVRGNMLLVKVGGDEDDYPIAEKLTKAGFSEISEELFRAA